MLLEITLTDNLLIFIIVIAFLLLTVLYGIMSTHKDNMHKLKIEIQNNKGIINEKDTQIEKIIAEMKAKAQDTAVIIFEEWKNKELQNYIRAIDETSRKNADTLLRQWIIDNEARIRKDAANRSVRNVLGKVTEHLIPFSEAMKQFNPKDVRFIGSPIDLIVFDGAEELKKDEIVIYFIEVKTGTSALKKKQQLIMDAVKKRRVEWLKVDIKDFGDEVNAALLE